MITHQVENINKEIEVIIKNQTETLELKKHITEIKHPLYKGSTTVLGCNNSNLEDRSIEIIYSEKQVEKRKSRKRNLKRPMKTSSLPN